MMRHFASHLSAFAALVLPKAREAWGSAMRAELAHIEDDRSALLHASGCFVAAIRERTRDFETQFSFGIWGIALTTGASAIFHIQCAVRGVGTLFGRPDGFLSTLLRVGTAYADVVANYQRAMPIVIACFFGLGIAHLAGVYFLLRWQLQRFLVACGTAFAIAVTAVTIQLSVVWTLDGVPSEFIALIVQSIALPALLLWSNGRHSQLRRAK